MENIISELLSLIKHKNIIKITYSNIRNKDLELDKVIAKLVNVKNSLHVQFEYRYKRIIKHTNIEINDNDQLVSTINELFNLAKDINVQTSDEEINIKVSKKYKVTVKRKKYNKKTFFRT